jgi:hypothetical protein
MSDEAVTPERTTSTSWLTPEDAAAVLASATPIPTGRPGRTTATSFGGVDAHGEPVVVRIAAPSVFLALSTSCDGCQELASIVVDGIEGFEVLGLLRPARDEASQAQMTAFTQRGGRWVVGDEGFDALDAGSPPFFCVVEPSGLVVVEGVAFGREHLESHLARVRAGAPRPDSVRLRPGG